MNFLTNWINQMIILVIIMMITTMILPDRKMKKYAQFSLSLIFILFFIQPITQLFNLNLVNESSKVIDSILGDMSTQEVEDAVDLQKSEIQASNDAYVIEELTNQLKKEMGAEFAQDFDYHLDDIVIISENSENIDPETLTFHFQITEAEDNPSEIDPVIINTSKTKDQKEADFNDYDQDMINWFSEKLEIDQTQIRLSWEGG
ncbi:stage III sporulation protein AF [Amphibacillus sp. Q70]|uniref:stage III sporulation protein AF n=1 Tax=Amphibacillus sp. Q70 TaxID=3453416 RepID=UPI003F87B75A